MRTDGVSAIDYTPRQAQALLKIDREHKRRENATALQCAALGARGDWKEVQKLVEEWSK